MALVYAKARQGRHWMCCSLPVSICPNAPTLERRVGFINRHRCRQGAHINNQKNKQTNQHRAKASLLLIWGWRPRNHVHIKWLLGRFNQPRAKRLGSPELRDPHVAHQKCCLNRVYHPEEFIIPSVLASKQQEKVAR